MPELHPPGEAMPSSPPAAASCSSRADPDLRASETESRMTDDERFSLLYSLMVRVFGRTEGAARAGGTARHRGLHQRRASSRHPSLKMADASLGLRHTGGRGDGATAFPPLALGASFNPRLARTIGCVIGKEARAASTWRWAAASTWCARCATAGTSNTSPKIPCCPARWGRHGPRHAGGRRARGAQARLAQRQRNQQVLLDAVIDPAAHRESDLLAFQIAIEQSEPGALMGRTTSSTAPMLAAIAPSCRRRSATRWASRAG